MSFIIKHWSTIAIMLLVTYTVYITKQNKDLRTNLDDAQITIKSINVGIQQYKAKDSTWNVRLINERLSKKEIVNSQDSIIIKLRKQLDNASIKYNNVLALGYNKTSIKTDTVVKYVRTYVAGTTPIDTVLDFSKRPYIVNTVTLTSETASNHLEVNNEQFLITNGKKETVTKRKSFFLWRWFQKKHWVVYTDVHNSNPYIKTDSSKFITILENDGEVKTKAN